MISTSYSPELNVGERDQSEAKFETAARAPDVTVVLGPRPDAPILRTPPFICVEVLSPEDVWVVDPRLQRGWIVTKEGTVAAQDDVLTTTNPEITVPLSEIYARIEEL